MTKPKIAFAREGGRPKASVAMPALEHNFVQVVSDHTAGDPMREDVVWTILSPTEIAEQLGQRGTPVSPDTVRDLLKDFGFRRRQAEKVKTKADVPHRNRQFEIIADLKQRYEGSPNPIISMDTKKKEFLGDLFRPGRGYATGPNPTLDHDFPSYAQGKVIPHGLYDVKRNVGHLTLGTSHDTSQFACDSLRLWWRRHGQRVYPDAASILLLCDGGGSNNCRHHIFKEDLQQLVNRIGVPVRVAHYPTHCSKYNPIEHRLFPHVTRAWAGIVFRTLEVVTDCLRRVWTSRGLHVTYAVLDKTYQLRREATRQFMNAYPIQFAKELPEWNYTVAPQVY